MSSFNKVILMGRLTRDPELRSTASGLNICKISIAVSRKFKSADGETKEETTFVDVDSFGKQAEVIAKFFSKGKPIFIEGRLKFEQWETNNGEKRSKMGVVLENFQFIGEKSDSSFSSNSTSSPASRTLEPARVSDSHLDMDEDVPF